ncbi:MAG: HK97 family phage prohead protease [Pseudomonadota bacterium]
MNRNQKKNEIERRNFPVTELRAITDEQGLRHIVGYAAVFDTLSEDLGWFREKIEKGAFAETLKNDDIRALKNHNDDYVLGRNRSKTLALSEDDHGLKIDIMPPDTQWARDLMVSIERGDIDQMSFGFQTLTDEWNMVEGKDIRTLIKVRLFDVSPVTFPAYPDTEVGLRSLEEYRKKSNSPPSGGDGAEDVLRSTVLLGEEDETYRKIVGF